MFSTTWDAEMKRQAPPGEQNVARLFIPTFLDKHERS